MNFFYISFDNHKKSKLKAAGMKYSLDKYSMILKTCLEFGWSFRNFSELKSNEGGIILLRHDVDNDVQAARKMAFLENKLGIRSTYFLMTRSPIYNLFSRHNQDAVEEILKLGQVLVALIKMMRIRALRREMKKIIAIVVC